jgi:hypothetical protein
MDGLELASSAVTAPAEGAAAIAAGFTNTDFTAL